MWIPRFIEKYLKYLMHKEFWRIEELIQQKIQSALECERSRIIFQDPLLLLQENAQTRLEQLRRGTNYVGENVNVGERVILWGGVFPGGVGLRIHNSVRIYDECKLVIDHASPESGIILKDQVAMNFGCYLDGSGGIIVGERTIFGPNVVIVSSSHRIESQIEIQRSGKTYARVEIGCDVWIGANVVIRSGVVIGDRSVVGAGSIVTQNVPPDTVVAGNPARIQRIIDART